MRFLAATIFILVASAHFAFAQVTIPTAQQDTSNELTVKVKGITCAMDLKMISANVEALDDVAKCEAVKEGPTTTFKVRYKQGAITEKEIYAAIEGTGSCEDPNERPYKVKK